MKVNYRVPLVNIWISPHPPFVSSGNLRDIAWSNGRFFLCQVVPANEEKRGWLDELPKMKQDDVNRLWTDIYIYIYICIYIYIKSDQNISIHLPPRWSFIKFETTKWCFDWNWNILIEQDWVIDSWLHQWSVWSVQPSFWPCFLLLDFGCGRHDPMAGTSYLSQALVASRSGSNLETMLMIQRVKTHLPLQIVFVFRNMLFPVMSPECIPLQRTCINVFKNTIV